MLSTSSAETAMGDEVKYAQFLSELLGFLSDCRWEYGRSTLQRTPERETELEIRQVRYYIGDLRDSLEILSEEIASQAESDQFQSLETFVNNFTHGDPEDQWSSPGSVRNFVLHCIRERRVPKPGDDDYPDHQMGLGNC